MITGIVSADLEALLQIRVVGSSGQTASITVVIDTGFDGYLTLPQAVIERLNLGLLGRAETLLGDGSIAFFAVHRAAVEWLGEVTSIEIDVAETTPLLGMALLNGCDLSIQVRPNGLVTVSRPE